MVRASSLAPGVSVVIPVKNRARLLAQTLRSVREQSLQPEEVIVIDDGSTDESTAVARDAGATVIGSRHESRGPAAARNHGLARVRTELACPLDSDDLVGPRALEVLADALATNPEAPFAFGEALEATRESDGWHPTGIVAPRGPELADLPCSLYARNFVPASGVVVRTREIQDVGGYPTSLAFNEDHYLWIQLARRGWPAHVPDVVAVARRHGGSRHDALAHVAADEVTRLADDDPRLRACRPERLGVLLVNMCTTAVRARRPGEAARVSRDLVLRQPHRGRILRSAGWWWRTRRASPRRAGEVWRSDPGLRRFLNSFE